MFQTASSLKTLRDILSSHMELPEYFLGMHASFDGEVIFARDVVHINIDLAPFQVDFQNLWDWFREQLRGPSGQETFAYELTFGVEDEQDPAMEALIKITRGSAKTVWMIDLAQQETSAKGRRFVIVTVPDKKRAQEFRDEFDGREIVAA